jgi:hypothetical protein
MAINPYESPRELDEQPDPGIGSWREGDLLVMHVIAELPRYCVHTNQPADGARGGILTWRPTGTWVSRTHRFWLPQSRKYLLLYAREKNVCRTGAFLVGTGTLALVVLIAALSIQGPHWLSGSALDQVWDVIQILSGFFCCLNIPVGLILMLYFFIQNRPPLKCVHGWDDYVWFAGAHPGFLNRLPEWPRKSQMP